MRWDQNQVEELKKEIQKELGHSYVKVRPFGQHLLIQREEGKEGETVARITPTGKKDHYTAAFRNHMGRYEPLPCEGNLLEVGSLIATLLEPYFDPTPFD